MKKIKFFLISVLLVTSTTLVFADIHISPDGSATCDNGCSVYERTPGGIRVCEYGGGCVTFEIK